MVAEGAVMLDEYHRGLRIQQQLLYLHTREQVYIVQRLVPDIHVRLLAKARRDEHLFPLSGAETGHVAVKMPARHVQLAQKGFDPALVNAPLAGKAAQIAAQKRAVLRDV